MIYLIDEKLGDVSHSRYISDILKKHTSVEFELVEISRSSLVKELESIFFNLRKKINHDDIILCCWATIANQDIDDLFNDLSEHCWVVVAAGNFNKDIKYFSPARAERVITVACLNKSGEKATLSNYGESKSLVWVPGTNYNVGWKNSSGTSVSAAIYTAFLAESLKEKDIKMLYQMLEEYKKTVLKELNI